MTFQYPKFLAVCENRQYNSNSLINHGYGILFHGAKGTMFLDRAGYRIWPEKGADLQPEEIKGRGPGNMERWANFLDCIQTRKRPNAGVELNHKTSTPCHPGNISYRSKLRVDFDLATERFARESQALEDCGVAGRPARRWHAPRLLPGFGSRTLRRGHNH